MRGPEKLFENENAWHTRMGAWFPQQGRVVFRGKELFQDLGDLPWMGLLLYGITGRIPDEKQIRLFEGMWSLCTSYPDPRLWNNRVAALAGTARSTAALAVSAATAISEASIYGRRPDIRSIDFLLRVQRHLDEGAGLSDLIRTELKTYRVIPGFGRPITLRDERIDALMAHARKLGFSEGHYVRLAFKIDEILAKSRMRWRMNVAALGAALAMDQDFSPREFYHFLILSFSAGILACYIDASEKDEGSLFPLRCTRIDFKGVPYRKWETRIPE